MSYGSNKRSDKQKQFANFDSSIIKAARHVHRLYTDSYPDLPTPNGVVINRGNLTGKLIYSYPVLLPTESFVPIEVITNSNDYY
jgi:hypothetical protein